MTANHWIAIGICIVLTLLHLAAAYSAMPTWLLDAFSAIREFFVKPEDTDPDLEGETHERTS